MSIVKEMAYYEGRAELVRALANPFRLMMVDMLRGGELCVCQFNEALELDYSTISRHLTVLRRAGIAGSRKSGKNVYYHLKVPCIVSFFDCFEDVLKMNADATRSLVSMDGSE